MNQCETGAKGGAKRHVLTAAGAPAPSLVRLTHQRFTPVREAGALRLLLRKPCLDPKVD